MQRRHGTLTEATPLCSTNGRERYDPAAGPFERIFQVRSLRLTVHRGKPLENQFGCPAHTPAAGSASPDAQTQAKEFGSSTTAGSAELTPGPKPQPDGTSLRNGNDLSPRHRGEALGTNNSPGLHPPAGRVQAPHAHHQFQSGSQSVLGRLQQSTVGTPDAHALGDADQHAIPPAQDGDTSVLVGLARQSLAQTTLLWQVAPRALDHAFTKEHTHRLEDFACQGRQTQRDTHRASQRTHAR